MATGAVLSQDIQEIKRPPDSGLPVLSSSRPGNGNYPDIVDNENCFQPVNSDSCPNINDVNSASQNSHDGVMQSDVHVSRSNAPAGESLQQSNPAPRGANREVETSDTAISNPVSSNPRTISVPVCTSTSSGTTTTTSTSHLPNRPSAQVRQNSPSRGARTTTSNQINTRDLNTGITSRLDAQRTTNSALPDILHSHQVPSTSPPRPNPHRPPARYTDHRHARQVENQRRNHHRHRHREHNRANRHSRSSRARSQSVSSHSNGICKDPCCRCLATVTSFRWVLVILSLLGVCCVVTGIILAALHATGNSFLILAIMFIGLGVLLVIVVGVGWKCTPRGHEPLHALFGLGEFRRLRETRRPRGHRRNRDANWYGGVLYPEFQHRRPPPSYAVSMQDYQHQILLAQQNQSHNNNGLDDLSLPSSPPPSYRSRASNVRQSAHITFPPSRDHAPDSHPPSYRSNISTSGHQRPPLPMSSGEVESYEDSRVADVAFTGPESVDVDLTVLPREDYSNSSESECETSAAQNNSASSDFDRRVERNSLPRNTNSAEVAQNSRDDNNLDPMVQETLKSFDDIAASAGITDDDNEHTHF